uniref:NAD(P)H-hydrate epimerase n=1 Tax=Albugo laibachii Nc14 TaxID=890382 RepID=F0WVF0_9STRA|nr:hypothetical protein BRAFLDRAFT_104103 [Albugo laibachii Nc14]CCA25464.1 hypothetical protein BRAFLDRAFT_104103 [Albugo laibachii Nc14]|eukprot:CCA25464.1 hypothetical protein BRAFLDRAFT_104103 [Albugo laibachii Nc14]
MVKFITQAQARNLDVILIEQYHYTLERLMELAGLSVACAIEREFPTSQAAKSSDLNILTIAGRGNNGQAKEIETNCSMFGYSPSVYYPKATDNELFNKLVSQCSSLNIPLLYHLPHPSTIDEQFGLILDGIFGFGFKGEIRDPFLQIINQIKQCRSARIVSIDIPSGWEVDTGNLNGQGLDPYMLVSMSVPKVCARFHEEKGDTIHYLGGRFIPENLNELWSLSLPKFLGSDQCVKLKPTAST